MILGFFKIIILQLYSIGSFMDSGKFQINQLDCTTFQSEK